jgi:hypothetical protein
MVMEPDCNTENTGQREYVKTVSILIDELEVLVIVIILMLSSPVNTVPKSIESAEIVILQDNSLAIID